MGLVNDIDRKVEGPKWLEGLTAMLDPVQISVAADTREEFGADRWHASAIPEVVVHALSRDDVVATLKYANENNIPVTTRGAGVGYVGGCVPVKGGILLSVRKMDRIIEVNTADGVAVVEPGVILDDLQESVRKRGWYYPCLLYTSPSPRDH